MDICKYAGRVREIGVEGLRVTCGEYVGAVSLPDIRPVRPRVVIIGCGFAGLAAANELAGRAIEVTVIDRANHHLFQPLLYQVATAGLAAPAIASPIRHVLRDARNVRTLMGEVTAIDPERRRVSLDGGGSVAYDFLIVASGAAHSYFGHDEWARHAPGLKTLDDALEIRRRILGAFERAERATTPEERQSWLSFAVVGAGPTGVELAGTLAEIARHSLRREFRQIDPRSARVILLDGSDRVLPGYPADLSHQARRQLEQLRVEVRTACRVTAIDDDGLAIGNERLPARTVLWAAGVAASPLGAQLGADRDGVGRVRVAADLSVVGHSNIFVAGDLASASSAGQRVPGIAPAAKQMGRLAARNVLRRAKHRPTREFRYRDYGSLATIGRSAAVASIGGWKFWGRPAWLLWLLAHIYFLIGFRNRLMVMTDWAFAYWTSQRSARVMVSSSNADSGDARPPESSAQRASSP